MAAHQSLLAAALAAAVCLAISPYLARLTVSLPDRDRHDWWRGAKPAAPVPALAAVLAGLFGAIGGRATGWTAVWPAFVLLAVVGVVLTIVDAQTHRLPNRLMLPALGLSVVLLALGALPSGQWHRLLVALGAAAVAGAVFFLLWFAVPKSIGLGDVKLIVLLGLFTGWFGAGFAVLAIFAGFVVGAAVAVTRMLTGRAGLRTELAFGPMLICGSYLALLTV